MSTAKSSKTATVIDPASQVGNAIAVQKDTIETVVKAGTEAAVKSVDKAVSLSKEQVDAAMREVPSPSRASRILFASAATTSTPG